MEFYLIGKRCCFLTKFVLFLYLIVSANWFFLVIKFAICLCLALYYIFIFYSYSNIVFKNFEGLYLLSVIFYIDSFYKLYYFIFYFLDSLLLDKKFLYSISCLTISFIENYFFLFKSSNNSLFLASSIFCCYFHFY